VESLVSSIRGEINHLVWLPFVPAALMPFFFFFLASEFSQLFSKTGVLPIHILQVESLKF
jgi:hypothetical protein